MFLSKERRNDNRTGDQLDIVYHLINKEAAYSRLEPQNFDVVHFYSWLPYFQGEVRCPVLKAITFMGRKTASPHTYYDDITLLI
jgi:hypothetical protein